jgi:CheY-like chemotaxis protein
MEEQKPPNGSLILHSTQQLSVRASIVKRGLQELTQHSLPAVAWSRPHLIGTLSRPSESFDHVDPEKKTIYFHCQIRNWTDAPRDITPDIGLLRRSRKTGKIVSIAKDGLGCPAPTLSIPAKGESSAIIVGLSFQRQKPFADCLAELFTESCELLAYDPQFHTILNISLDSPNHVGLPNSVLQRKRILEVDDEESIRAIIGSMLRDAGYDCISVPNGVDALALLESGEKFDLLLNDLMNSPMDGITLLERAQKGFPDLPVIIATAVHDVSIVLAALHFGASDYLLLPFERHQLLTIVRQALACHSQPKRKLMQWESGLFDAVKPSISGLFDVIMPSNEGQLVVRTADGTPKLIWDLAPGDIVLVNGGNKLQKLCLVERDGKLAYIYQQ